MKVIGSAKVVRSGLAFSTTTALVSMSRDFVADRESGS